MRVNVDLTSILHRSLIALSLSPALCIPTPQSLSLTHIFSGTEILKYLHQVKFNIEKGPIRLEVWPTKEEFQLTKNRVQYNREKVDFAVCGSSGTGKSLRSSIPSVVWRTTVLKATLTGMVELPCLSLGFLTPAKSCHSLVWLWVLARLKFLLGSTSTYLVSISSSWYTIW